MKVRIYQPARNAMQSGRARVGGWVLEYETPTPRRPESLMGWTSSGDTLNQVRMRFHTEKEAVAFAEKKGWSYDLQPGQERKVRPRSYADNFKILPPEDDDIASATRP